MGDRHRKGVRSSHRKCEICGKQEIHADRKLSYNFFSKFPLDATRCKKWVRAVGNEDLVHLPIEKLHQLRYVCGLHFEKKCFNKNGNRLKKYAVPKLQLSAPPLSDELLSTFPVHTAQKENVAVHVDSDPSSSVQPSTSKHDDDTNRKALSENNFEVSIPQADLILTSTRHQHKKAKITPQSCSVQPSTSHQNDGENKNIKKKLHEDLELTPRKKILVEKLKRTKCTIKSLKRSALLIENIQSPVVKELVVNTCRNKKKKPQGRRWTMKHKLSCLAILKRSPRTYRYLSTAATLPSIKTLQNILKKIPMTPGINQHVLNHLKTIADSKDPRDRICNLAFDEMALKSRIILNEGNDIIEGFEDLGDAGRTTELADHALVFLLQGLKQKFKQPIAFYFTKGTISSTSLAKIIKMIIIEVGACGFTILNTICDQGPTNMGALRLLRQNSGTSENVSNHYFKINNKNVYIMFDIPHLFKSIRNNFLKAGCINMNGTKGKWEHLVEMEKHNRNFLYFSKITQAHVNPKYKAKMRVKLAAQILSNTVAAVLKLLARGESGEKSTELHNTAHVVEKLDQLFNYSNGPSGPDDIIRNKRQNVSVKTNHMEIWAEYIKILSNTSFMCKNGQILKNVKCIEGYITSLKSLRDIWWTVQGLGFKYLNLRNLNQDALENLFGVIRQHSPTNRNPTATHFMAALKTAVVTKLTAPHSRGSNCENDNKTLLTDLHKFVYADDAATTSDPDSDDNATIDKTDVTLQAPMSTGEVSEKSLMIPMLEDELLVLSEEVEPDYDFSMLSEQPTVYVAGYIAKQALKKYKCEKCKQNLTVNNPADNPMYTYILLREWWQSKFSLTYPSTNFCQTIQILVNITETELLPQIHKPNICLLGCTLYEVVCPNSCFTCNIHSNDLKLTCFKITCKLLLRRQCQRINQSLASKEEDLASQNKRAEQQGKAK